MRCAMLDELEYTFDAEDAFACVEHAADEAYMLALHEDDEADALTDAILTRAEHDYVMFEEPAPVASATVSVTRDMMRRILADKRREPAVARARAAIAAHAMAA